jgi:hypothetical protein
VVDARLTALAHEVLYLVSDRAKALSVAEQGLGCLSMPDFFHVIHEIVKSYSLAMGWCLRDTHTGTPESRGGLARRQELPHGGPSSSRGHG